MSIHTISTSYRDYTHTADIGSHKVQWIYFVVEARDTDGELLDYSQTPGGYALYRMPLSDGEYDPMLSVEKLETVTTLAPETVVLALETSPDQSELYMITGTETDVTLHILDAATGQEKQSFPTIGKSDFWYNIGAGEGFFLLGVNGELRLYCRDENGAYTEAIAADVSGFDFAAYQWLDAVYDGERLALLYESSLKWIQQGSRW